MPMARIGAYAPFGGAGIMSTRSDLVGEPGSRRLHSHAIAPTIFAIDEMGSSGSPSGVKPARQVEVRRTCAVSAARARGLLGRCLRYAVDGAPFFRALRCSRLRYQSMSRERRRVPGAAASSARLTRVQRRLDAPRRRRSVRGIRRAGRSRRGGLPSRINQRRSGLDSGAADPAPRAFTAADDWRLLSACDLPTCSGLLTVFLQVCP